MTMISSLRISSLVCLVSILYCDAFTVKHTTKISSSPSWSATTLLSRRTLTTKTFTVLLPAHKSNDLKDAEMPNRRICFDKALQFVAFSGILVSSSPISTLAIEEPQVLAEDLSSFKRVNVKLGFGYEFIPPPSVIKTSNKPLQTHLDEINLPTNTKGYTYGVTVDPIRITSLKDFGTPSEVAAKIVMAELRRDGVLDVTLTRDAKEDMTSGAYDVEYVSDGKRGKKHFVTRTVVNDGKLYVLTVQVKEDEWKDLEAEVIDAVHSFHVIGKEGW